MYARLQRMALVVLAAGTTLAAGSEPGEVSTPLPAGLFWTGYDTCRFECPRPAAAVLLSVEATAEGAQARLASLPTASLPLGYPLVVHTDEIGAFAGEPGILILLGVFADAASAEAWRTTLPEVLQASHVIALSGEPVPWPGDNESGPHRVVLIQAGPPVPAYPTAAIREALNGSEYGVTPEQILATSAVAPLCEVPGGTVFLAPAGAVSDSYYQFAPVACDGQPAMVRWDQTLLDALVWTAPDGTGHVRQVIGAECDSPFMSEWQYSPNGRGALIEDGRGGGGCGAY